MQGIRTPAESGNALAHAVIDQLLFVLVFIAAFLGCPWLLCGWLEKNGTMPPQNLAEHEVCPFRTLVYKCCLVSNSASGCDNVAYPVLGTHLSPACTGPAPWPVCPLVVWATKQNRMGASSLWIEGWGGEFKTQYSCRGVSVHIQWPRSQYVPICLGIPLKPTCRR